MSDASEPHNTHTVGDVGVEKGEEEQLNDAR